MPHDSLANAPSNTAKAHDAHETTRLVFVYGTLRAGGSNDINRYVPRPERVGESTIEGVLYDFGAYPGLVLRNATDATSVKGEVYRVEPSVERQLDLLEDVTEDDSGEYIRREVDVMVDGATLRCLVYEIHPSRLGGCPVIASGNWFDR